MDHAPTRALAVLSRLAVALLIPGLAAGLLGAAASPGRADTPAPGPQWITKSDSGVLYWEDGSEVRLWGVNYFVPFSGEYANLKRLRADINSVIDRDLDDIQALEGNLVRVMVFDREITDPEGNLRDNPHLNALDYLVAACRERGMYVYITPISWVESDGDSTNGFSDHWYRDELVRLREAWPPQENYLRRLAGHVNPHTGLAYAADPVIAVWDILCDPQATGMTKNIIPLDQSAAYARRMMTVLREGGVRNPVVYSAYGLRFDKPEYSVVFEQSGVDGWSFELPVGGTAARVHTSNYLSSRVWQAWLLRHPIEWVWGETFCPTFSAYSFAGELKSYMYPPLARSLVASGVQVAALYQYDSLPLAAHNAAFRLVWFNREFTPAAGMGFRMGARLFRETPLGKPVPEGLPEDNWNVDGMRASQWLDVATLEEDGEFLFTNAPPFELEGTLEDYRLLAGADSTNLLGFTGQRWFTSSFDAADGRLDLELGPKARLLESNPFETGKLSLNIRFCKKVAELDLEPSWVQLRLTDTTVAVYRENAGDWEPVPAEGLRFDAVPGRYRVYLDESR